MKTEMIVDYIRDNLGLEAIVLNRLMGGMSNYTYLIKVNEEFYTFRVPGDGAQHFVDRVIELKNIDMISSLDFCPKPDYFNIKNGYKISEYVEGIPMHELDVKPYDKVTTLLKRLHTSTKFDNDYDPIKRLSYYESINETDNPLYDALKEQWLSIYNSILKHVPLVPCHGDAQPSNFVVGEECLYLVDWEFAGNNDPIYDIACFGNANFKDALALLKVYFEDCDKEKYQRLYSWRMFQCLQWYNVASYKDQIGLSEKLEIDFNYISKIYIDKAKYFYKQYLELTEV